LVDPQSSEVQVLVLSPTRELAEQTYKVVNGMGNYLKVKAHLSVGGTKVFEDKKRLAEGVNYLVGTPGRIKDLIKREFFQTHHLKVVIIDEADEMLGRGFLEDINDMLSVIPPETQMCMFSATMPPEIIKMTEAIMKDPCRILVQNKELTLEGIKQYYISCKDDEVKMDNIIELFSLLEVNQCMIYCNTVAKADYLTAFMRERKLVVGCLHAKLEQSERQRIMEQFRTGASRILVTTNVLARGIDVYQVGLVINFDLPLQKESYIHRIGRSGRYGRRGLAINLITRQEADVLFMIEEFYNTKIENLPTDLAELEE